MLFRFVHDVTCNLWCVNVFISKCEMEVHSLLVELSRVILSPRHRLLFLYFFMDHQWKPQHAHHRPATSRLKSVPRIHGVVFIYQNKHFPFKNSKGRVVCKYSQLPSLTAHSNKFTRVSYHMCLTHTRSSVRAWAWSLIFCTFWSWRGGWSAWKLLHVFFGVYLFSYFA